MVCECEQLVLPQSATLSCQKPKTELSSVISIKRHIWVLVFDFWYLLIAFCVRQSPVENSNDRLENANSGFFCPKLFYGRKSPQFSLSTYLFSRDELTIGILVLIPFRYDSSVKAFRRNIA
ncbi:MAG: hypothetical protein LBC20_09435 [Planctomycetaceae bacterium]|nr:hypothetical protein [Planctomycetaceae bacterium]